MCRSDYIGIERFRVCFRRQNGEFMEFTNELQENHVNRYKLTRTTSSRCLKSAF